MLDIKLLLDELGIEYKESGKNVGGNDVNIDCPYCGWEKHLSVNVATGKVWCWVCEFADEEKRPYLIPVLWRLTDLKWGDIWEIAKDHGWESHQNEDEPKKDNRRKVCYLPDECLPFTSKYADDALRYLADRGFDENTIIDYDLRFCRTGWNKNRIIIPVYQGEKLVTYTTRKYKGAGSRYRHAPIWASVERIKNLLYNAHIAMQYDKIYVLEGPSDVWRMGKDSVCVFRSNLSKLQRNLLFAASPKAITIIYDPNATGRAYRAAETLSLRIPIIKVVRLDGKDDVADRSREEIEYIESKTPIYRG